MQLNIKLMTNLTLQLKFITIILGITVAVILGCLDLNWSMLVYLIINCICLGVSLLLFLCTACGIRKKSGILLKFEKVFHILGGCLLIISSSITLWFGLDRFWLYQTTMSSALIGLLINAPLYILIGWQLWGSQINPENLRSIYFSISLTNNPVKEDINAEPPKYSETFKEAFQYQSDISSPKNAPPEYFQSNAEIPQKIKHGLLPTVAGMV